MASTLSIQSSDNIEREEVLRLVNAAITSEEHRLELALELARKRLATFETTYHVSSETFITTYTAEDLPGGDDEYVEWAGEYKLKQRLQTHLERLRGVRYASA